MAELPLAALSGAADTRRRELPAAIALAILSGGLSAAILGSVAPVGWAAAISLLLIADAEIYRRLDLADRTLSMRAQVVLAAWAFFTSAAYAVLPAALWLNGQAAGAAAAMILWVGGVVRHLGRNSGSLIIAAAGAAPPALSLLFAPLAIAAASARPDWDLGFIAAIGGAALMVYVAQARIGAADAERALRDSTASENLQHTLAQLLLDNTTLSAFLIDRDGRVQAVSQRAQGEAEAIGRRFEDVCPWTPLHWRETFASALQGQNVACEEDEVITSAGPRWMQWEARPWRAPDGPICGVIAFGRDITEIAEARKAADANEARLRLALAADRGLVWEIDFKRRSIAWFGDPAPVYGRAFDFDEAVNGQSPLLLDEEAASVRAYLESAGVDAADSFEHRVLRPDGRISWVQMTAHRVPGRSGGVRKLIVLSKDITARKREESAFLDAMRHAETALRAKRAMLMDGGAPAPVAAAEPAFAPVSVAEMFERLRALLNEMDVRDTVLAETLASLRIARASAENANVSKSQFLASMSHELRTPLNAIVGYSEILLEEAEADGRETDQKDIERVLSSARQLLHLINGILDLSKIEAGRMDVSISEFDVAKLINEAVATVRPAAERNANLVRIEIESGLGSAQTDAFKLNQCLLNLLSNAAKFTRDGDIVVRARREAGEGGDWIEISVADSGIGMSEEQLLRLFEPFMQAEVSTARKYGGTGLGLAITRRMMGLLHGDVSATSVPGRGSTFTLRAPAKRGEAPAPAQMQAGAMIADGRGHSVLVIDDEESASDLVARSLTRLGFGVHEAKTGAAGLAMAETEGPSAIVLDINLPDMSGWELLRALRAAPATRNIPIIVHSVDDDRQRAFALGAAAHVVKPADRDVLAATVARVARPHQALSKPASEPASILTKTA